MVLGEMSLSTAFTTINPMATRGYGRCRIGLVLLGQAIWASTQVPVEALAHRARRGIRRRSLALRPVAVLS